MKKITLLLLMLPIFSFCQWTQVGSDIDGVEAGESSGYAVSLSADGSIMAIGAIYHDSDKGTTRIFTNNGGVWQQIGSDIDGVQAGEQSGYSVSLSADGNILAIGAPYHGITANAIAIGTTRIYKNNGGVWQQVGSDIDGVDEEDYSGTRISLSSDGSTVAIGGWDFTRLIGTTRIYKNNGGVWQQIGSDIDGVEVGEQSSFSVSINDDGSIVAIGAYVHDSDKGTTRIFTNNGGVWQQIGSDIDGVQADEKSGWAVSLNGDGSIVAIGADRHDSSKGTTRIYKNNGGVWQQIGSDIDGVDAGERSGSSLNLSSDGSIVAIGAFFHDSYKGTTRIYKNNGGVWQQVGSDIDGVDAGDLSGWYSSLSSDGSTLAIGAQNHDGDIGMTRVFRNQVLSVENNTFGKHFSVYPNPSFGVSQIQLGEVYNEVSVAVFNVLGKQVATQIHNNTSDIKLNTQQFNSGVYFIKVQSGIKKATIKLVVN